MTVSSTPPHNYDDEITRLLQQMRIAIEQITMLQNNMFVFKRNNQTILHDMTNGKYDVDDAKAKLHEIERITMEYQNETAEIDDYIKELQQQMLQLTTTNSQ